MPLIVPYLPLNPLLPRAKGAKGAEGMKKSKFLAAKRLTARSEQESAELTRILQDQRRRVVKELEKNREWRQMELGLNDDETKQREADMKHWESWLTNVDDDLEREPARIREFYNVQSHRIEPVGLVYLWPA